MSELYESSNGVNPLILKLISRHFPQAKGLVSRLPYGFAGLPGIYTFDDEKTVYRIAVVEPKEANAWWATPEDFSILTLDTWTMGEGKKTFKRFFTEAGTKVLEAQIARMRKGARDPAQAHQIERTIMSIITGRFASDLPSEIVVPKLEELPVIALEQNVS